MAIFGTSFATYNNTIYTHNHTSWDTAANLTYGTLLVLLFLPGLFFNLLVYYKNHRQAGTTTSLVYRALAVSDLVVLLSRGSHQLVVLLSPTQQPFYNKDPPDAIIRSVCLVYLVFEICMWALVPLMSVMRLVTLTAPFWARANSPAIRYFTIVFILLTFTGSAALSTPYILAPDAYFSSVTQWVIPRHGQTSQFIIDYVIPVILMTITSISSLLTVVVLIRSGGSSRGTRRSSAVTILLMSAALMLWNIMLFSLHSNELPIDHDDMPKFFAADKYEIYYLYYMITCFFPIFLSVYNSAVVVVRSSDMRSMVVRMWREGPVKWVSVCSSGGGDSTDLNRTGDKTVNIGVKREARSLGSPVGHVTRTNIQSRDLSRDMIRRHQQRAVTT